MEIRQPPLRTMQFDVWQRRLKLLAQVFIVVPVLYLPVAKSTLADTSVGTFSLTQLPSIPALPEALVEDTFAELIGSGVDITLPTGASSSDAIALSENSLVLTDLDGLVAQWNSEDTESTGARELLGSLRPLTEVVRDHQAFLMLKGRITQQLRTVFTRAHGALGPMSIGGLSPVGRRDHLVAMMLMDAAGQDPLEYPYQEYDSLESLAIGLLTGEIRLASIPVSQALQIPLEGGIEIVATSNSQRQDIMTKVPTLVSARIDLLFTDYIGLYTNTSGGTPESLEPIGNVESLSDITQWSEEIYELGLVDDYTNEGSFAVNILRELARMKRFADMLEQ